MADLPRKLVQVGESPWCHAGTPWHYVPHESSAGVGSYEPDYWRNDMYCGLPSPYIREWEMKVLFEEGQFKDQDTCKCCGQYKLA